jgi:hypothetical protein
MHYWGGIAAYLFRQVAGVWMLCNLQSTKSKSDECMNAVARPLVATRWSCLVLSGDLYSEASRAVTAGD